MAIAGGRSSIAQQPGMTTGNRAIFIGDGLAASGSAATAAPANPPGITGATAAPVMLGLAGGFMPNAGGNMLLWVTGDIVVSAIGSGATLQIAYGTGGPPDAANMYTEALLRESFADLDIISLKTHDSTITEGKAHHGMSALIDLVARKPI